MLIPPSKTRSLSIGAQVSVLAAALLTVCSAHAEKPPLPSWQEAGGGAGHEASLFPNQGDIFQGGNDLPELQVPPSFYHDDGASPVGSDVGNDMPNMPIGDVVGAARDVGQVVSNPSSMGQFLPVGVGGNNGGFPSGAVPGIAGVGGNNGGFPGGAVPGIAGIVGSVGQGQQPNLNGILQGLGGAVAAGAVLNGGGNGPFGQFIGNNQFMQGIAFIAILQNLMRGTNPIDGSARFDQTNTGRSAESAFVNLMQTGIDDSVGDLGQPMAPLGPVNPPAQCGRPNNLTAAQRARWDAQYERMNRLIRGSSLEGYVPPDGARHGIVTGSSEEWAAFYANLGVQESGNQNHVVGDHGRFVGNSNGIYQLSPLDYANYRQEMERAGLQPGTTIDGKPAFTIEQLRDPEINSRAMLAISESLIRRDGAIGSNATTGMARYWGPLRRGWDACA